MIELTEERKAELRSEFAYLIERYVQKQWIYDEAIDSVCDNEDERSYLRDCPWWIEVMP